LIEQFLFSPQGCAAPVWLAALGAGHHPSSAGASRQLYCSEAGPGAGGGGWCQGSVHLAAFAGIAALGVADAAASAIGLAVGRHRIFKGQPPHTWMP
jgi:hypothetical protein